MFIAKIEPATKRQRSFSELLECVTHVVAPRASPIQKGVMQSSALAARPGAWNIWSRTGSSQGSFPGAVGYFVPDALVILLSPRAMCFCGLRTCGIALSKGEPSSSAWSLFVSPLIHSPSTETRP